MNDNIYKTIIYAETLWLIYLLIFSPMAKPNSSSISLIYTEPYYFSPTSTLHPSYFSNSTYANPSLFFNKSHFDQTKLFD